MNVEQIIIAHLEKNKLDGLFSISFRCACLKDDLAPCGNMRMDCKPGVKIACDEFCDHPGEWHIE